MSSDIEAIIIGTILGFSLAFILYLFLLWIISLWSVEL